MQDYTILSFNFNRTNIENIETYHFPTVASAWTTKHRTSLRGVSSVSFVSFSCNNRDADAKNRNASCDFDLDRDAILPRSFPLILVTILGVFRVGFVRLIDPNIRRVLFLFSHRGPGRVIKSINEGGVSRSAMALESIH